MIINTEAKNRYKKGDKIAKRSSDDKAASGVVVSGELKTEVTFYFPCFCFYFLRLSTLRLNSFFYQFPYSLWWCSGDTKVFLLIFWSEFLQWVMEYLGRVLAGLFFVLNEWDGVVIYRRSRASSETRVRGVSEGIIECMVRWGKCEWSWIRMNLLR